MGSVYQGLKLIKLSSTIRTRGKQPIITPYSINKGAVVMSWSYGSWIYNYLCNQCLSPLKLWVRIPLKARCTTLCDKVCQWLAEGRWFSLGTPVSSTNKTYHHDITEILLKVALNTIKTPNQPINKVFWSDDFLVRVRNSHQENSPKSLTLISNPTVIQSCRILGQKTITPDIND